MALSSAQSALAGIYVKGDKEILAKLNALSSAEFATGVAFAVRKAHKDVALKDARRRAAGVGRRGNVAKSLVQKVKRSARFGGVLSVIGADTKYRDSITGHRPAKTIHLIEDGTKAHEINAKPGEHLMKVPIGGGRFRYLKSVHHPGTSPHPILVPSQERNRTRIVATVSKELGKKANRMWSKKYGLS